MKMKYLHKGTNFKICSFFTKINYKTMKLYDKLKEKNLVENFKEYVDLIRLREIKVNNVSVDDPNSIVEDIDHIKIGILNVID